MGCRLSPVSLGCTGKYYTVRYGAVRHATCTVLCFVVLYCAALYCILRWVPRCFVLYCSVLCGMVLYRTPTHTAQPPHGRAARSRPALQSNSTIVDRPHRNSVLGPGRLRPLWHIMLDPARLVRLNNNSTRDKGEYVLYWVASPRISCNHALSHAVHRANALGLPLVACYGLDASFPGATARSFAFLIQGLAELEESLRELHIRLLVRLTSPVPLVIALSHRAAVVVCEHSVCRVPRRWRLELACACECECVQVRRPHHTIPDHTPSHHTTHHHTTPHHTPSHHTTPHHTTPHPHHTTSRWRPTRLCLCNSRRTVSSRPLPH